MPQGVEVVDRGRVMIDGNRTVLLRDEGGAWTLFFDRDETEWLGERVTVRGTRYGFASLHVTGVARGSGEAPQAHTTKSWTIWLLAAPIVLGLLISLLSPARALWAAF